MVLGEQLRKILEVIAEIAENSISTSVRDTAVIDRTGLPDFEVRKSLNELESLGLIKLDIQVSGATDEKGRKFRLLNLTKEGIQELSSNQEFR
jgi:hypothetical protein